jgi:hypothetical protein
MPSFRFIRSILKSLDKEKLIELIKKRSDIAYYALETFVPEKTKKILWDLPSFDILNNRIQAALEKEEKGFLDLRFQHIILAVLSKNREYFIALKEKGANFDFLIQCEIPDDQDFNIFLYELGIEYYRLDFEKIAETQPKFLEYIIDNGIIEDDLLEYLLRKKEFVLFSQLVEQVEELELKTVLELLRNYRIINRNYIVKLLKEWNFFITAGFLMNLIKFLDLELLKFLMDNQLIELNPLLYLATLENQEESQKIFECLREANCPADSFILKILLENGKDKYFFSLIEFADRNLFTFYESIKDPRIFEELFRKGIFPENFSLLYLYELVSKDETKFLQIVNLIPQGILVEYSESYLDFEIFNPNMEYLSLLQNLRIKKTKEVYSFIINNFPSMFYIKRVVELGFPKTEEAYYLPFSNGKLEEVEWLRQKGFPLSERLFLYFSDNTFQYLLRNLESISIESYKILLTRGRLDLIKSLYSIRGINKPGNEKEFLDHCLFKENFEAFVWGFENSFPLGKDFQDKLMNKEFALKVLEFLIEKGYQFERCPKLAFRLVFEDHKDFVRITRLGYIMNSRILELLISKNKVMFPYKILKVLEKEEKRTMKLNNVSRLVESIYPELRRFLR